MIIVFIDIWDKAINKVSEISKLFSNAEFYLLHFGKITNKSNTKDYIFNDKINVIDITNGNDLNQLIKLLKPDLIILLTYYHLTDYIAMIIAKKYGIKVLYWQIGLFFLSGNKQKFSSYDKVKKNIRYMLHLLKVTIISKNPLIIYTGFIYILKYIFAFGNQRSIIFNNLAPDYFFCFGNYDKKVIQDRFKINKNIFTIGYFENYNEIPFNNEKEEYVLYLPQPIIEDYKYDKEDIIKTYIYMNKLFNKKGLKLLIKLHPRMDIDIYRNYNEDTKRLNFIDGEINSLIYNSRIILGHFSTALFTAIRYYKPIVYLPFSINQKKANFNFRIWEYGVGQFFTYEQLKLISPFDIKCNKKKYKEFIDEYIGELDIEKIKNNLQEIFNEGFEQK